ncbi:hypothetical protein OPV22_016109 [Ensete ventricosum]|uniref:NB-ARC domain-containing protein n=1 Tax=Ensete ventricosum TaxID=4639 RepID=A0AAV8QKC8_ENSVE|nr:hypothetical protein OPV22_016109 [Ensete ventricosum]
MAVFRTLIRSLRAPVPPLPLAAFSSSLLSPALAAAPYPFSFVLRLTSVPPPLFLPPSRWVPFSGPLFLSSPPWMLSQSATPLYLRGKDAIFPKDLLQVRSFPIPLGLRSLGEVRKGFGDVVKWREKGGVGGEVSEVVIRDKLLNLPNLISISRMVSGPLIGWMIVHDMYLPAFGALVVSGATDWVLISCVALAMVEKELLNQKQLKYQKGVQDKLKKLEADLRYIHAVIHSAAHLLIEDTHLATWLWELKDAALAAEVMHQYPIMRGSLLCQYSGLEGCESLLLHNASTMITGLIIIFDLKLSVCVSERFDVKRITRQMVESVCCHDQHHITNLDMVQATLKERLEAKRFLIVLDDIWNEVRSGWETIRKPFYSGREGRRVLATTRIPKVANMMGTKAKNIVFLKGLNDAEYWKFFYRCAFGEANPNDHPKPELIGKQIAKKLVGSPLAAKTIGGVLKSKLEEEHWRNIMESKLWQVEQQKDDIFPALKLSYEQLPPSALN